MRHVGLLTVTTISFVYSESSLNLILFILKKWHKKVDGRESKILEQINTGGRVRKEMKPVAVVI